MAIDVNQDVKDVSNQITSYQEYAEFKEQYDELKKQFGNSFEADYYKIKNHLDKYNRNKRKQDNTCTPFIKHLIDQLKKLKGSGLDTDKFVKKIFIDTIKKSKKNFGELFVKLCQEFLNCGENQSYKFNTTFYIPVESVDLFGILESSPSERIGKLFYEELPADFNLYQQNPSLNPFSMNRELYNRTQNLNQPFSIQTGSPYLGLSTQDLFDITYVENYVNAQAQVINGNFFKVELKPRSTFPTVNEFLNDYFSSINILEFKTLFTYLLEFSTGVLSFGQNQGKSKLFEIQKIMAINKRLSCLCVDNKKEISVDGNAKLSEIDNINDSFYELDDIDLRIIEQNISNIKLGIIEFEDCDNVKVPMNLEASLSAIENLIFNQDTNNVNEIDDALNILYPTTDQGFKPSLDTSFIEQFLNALMATIFSPKAILPLMIMVHATDQPIPNVKNIDDFASKGYRSFYLKYFLSLIAEFTKEIFAQLTKEIIKLTNFIKSEITQEKRERITKTLLRIITLVGTTRNFVLDFRECKSCLNELLKLLNSAIQLQTDKLQNRGSDIPLPLLLASKALSGYSTDRAFIESINNLKQIGVPTGPMPDGSPNKFVSSIYAILKGQADEWSVNSKNINAVPELTVIPYLNITIPKKSYGKSI